mmetsp:Transcript_23963/g.66617  ORF Transcript_23963/g.66617 Transcript_23963/m.66617 type:complete len:302 (+) Transcript_23963:276-1181(+)
MLELTEYLERLVVPISERYPSSASRVHGAPECGHLRICRGNRPSSRELGAHHPPIRPRHPHDSIAVKHLPPRRKVVALLLRAQNLLEAAEALKVRLEVDVKRRLPLLQETNVLKCHPTFMAAIEELEQLGFVAIKTERSELLNEVALAYATAVVVVEELEGNADSSSLLTKLLEARQQRGRRCMQLQDGDAPRAVVVHVVPNSRRVAPEANVLATTDELLLANLHDPLRVQLEPRPHRIAIARASKTEKLMEGNEADVIFRFFARLRRFWYIDREVLEVCDRFFFWSTPRGASWRRMTLRG